MDWDFALSPQGLVDIIDEEMGEFGLKGVVDEDMERVFAAELEPFCWSNFGMGDVLPDELPGRRVCSMDDNVSVASVLHLRIQPGEVKPSERYHRYRDAEKKDGARAIHDRVSEYMSATALKRRGGARFYGGMNEILTLNRKQRRALEAQRKRTIDRRSGR